MQVKGVNDMGTVAQRGTLITVNGPGRRALAQAVDRHRNRRIGSREAMAELAGVSPGTIKNVELTDRDLTARTLDAIDKALEWEPGTAREILVNNTPAPPLPVAQHATTASALPRRLMAEFEGQEVYEVRAVDVSGRDARVVLTLVGNADLDIPTIRAALLELDEMERKLREG